MSNIDLSEGEADTCHICKQVIPTLAKHVMALLNYKTLEIEYLICDYCIWITLVTDKFIFKGRKEIRYVCSNCGTS